MDLNFLDVQFELDFRLLEDYMVSGQDEVCFMISTNPGSAAASGAGYGIRR